MNSKPDQKELKELAAQLRCPHGERGLEVAAQMSRTNTSMLLESLPYLDIKDGQEILEIGPGDASHLSQLLSLGCDLRYTGLDISPLMKERSEAINEQYVTEGRATFCLYDGAQLPFDGSSFDRIITVNTLYFLSDPRSFFRQVRDILKPDGIFVLTFQEKTFIENLPFTQYGFECYGLDEVLACLKDAGLAPKDTVLRSEETVSKLGDPVTRTYHIVSCHRGG